MPYFNEDYHVMLTLYPQRSGTQIFLWEWQKHTEILSLKPTTRIKSQPELSLKREVLGWLIAARSGHGHFADFYERFGHETDLGCECGHRRTQLHPFSCPNAWSHRDKITASSCFLMNYIKKFPEWAPATGLFKRRYFVWSRLKETNRKRGGKGMVEERADFA